MSLDAMPTESYKYISTPNAVKSSSQTMRFQPVNGSSFTNNSNNVIRLELRQNAFLDGKSSYLKFTVTNNCNQIAYANGYASCILNRIRITSGGVVLSDISQYHQLANMLILNNTSDDFQRILQICSGGSASQAVGLVQAGSIGAGGSKTYSIPLISGLLSSSKFFPLGLVSSAGLVIELFLEPTLYNAFYFGTAPTTGMNYTVSQVEYVAKCVTIDDDNAYKMITNMMISSGLKIKTWDYETHINSITNGATSAVLTIPTRASSLKSLTTTLHYGTSAYNKSVIQAYRFGTTSYYYKVGGQNFPVSSVSVSADNLCEAFSELQKTFNSGLWNMNAHTFTNSTIFGTDNGSTGTELGSFCCSYDFENYDQSELFSGMDLSRLGLPVSFALTLNAPEALQAITFAHKDVVYNIQPDGSIIKQE